MIDTDVIAAGLLGEPAMGDESARLLAGRWDLHAPAHWKAELLRVVWKGVRLKRVPSTRVDSLLELAEALPIESVDVGELWRGALGLAMQEDQSPYDTLFVELAARLETRVATYDRRLRDRFPAHTCAPGDLLAEP